MKLDVLYCSHNRRQFTEASFATLLANTNWNLVNRLFIIDDDSTDGTLDYFLETLHRLARHGREATRFVNDRFGGPVAAMNYVLGQSDCELLAKVDNDLIVCPGWLEAMVEVLAENPELDGLGTEPGFVPTVQEAGGQRGYVPARWIGGQGVFRTRTMRRRPLVMKDRFFGLTAHWRDHARTGWINPGLPCFNLDHLPFEPWRSLSADYIKLGWQRAWEPYRDNLCAHWLWWTEGRMEAAG